MVDAAREKELKEARDRMFQFMRDNPSVDLHADLGVERTATKDEIEKIAKKKAKDLHPDAAERTYIAGNTQLKAQIEEMEKAARLRAQNLPEAELAEFRATNIKRFERMPEAEVRQVIASRDISTGKTRLLAPHKGAIEYHAQQNMAKLQELNMRKDILLNPDMMTHYEPPEKRAGFRSASGPSAGAGQRTGQAGPQHGGAGPRPHGGGEGRTNTGANAGARTGSAGFAGGTAGAAGAGARREPPRQETPRQDVPPREPPRRDPPQDTPRQNAAGASQGTSGHGAAGGGQPPHGDNPQHGGEDEKPKGKTVHILPPSRKALAVKAVFGALAAVAIGVGIAKYKLNSHEQDRVDSSPIKTRTYPTAAQMEKAQGSERIFVEQALGITGLSGMAVKDRGKSLQEKTGLTPQQFARISLALGSDAVKTDATRQMKSPDQKASIILVEEKDGRYVPVDAKTARDKYADSPKVTVDMSKPEVTLTHEDPRNGKGPQTATFANAEMVQNHLILDAAARKAAMASTIDAAEAGLAAAKAASAASSPETAKNGQPKP